MEEATTYILQHKDGGYLQRTQKNQLVRVSAQAQATRFTQKKANNLLHSSIKPDQRELWEIIPVPELAKPAQAAPVIAATVPAQAQDAEPMTMEVNVKCNLPDGPVDLTQLVLEQQAVYEKVLAYKEQLPHDLKKAEQEMFDLMHYIEFANLNAAEGYNIYSAFKECRLRRRRLKNDLAKFAILEKATLEDLLTGKLAEAMRQIDDEQIYRPRQLNELFTKISG